MRSQGISDLQMYNEESQKVFSLFFDYEEGEYSDSFKGGDDTSSLCSGVSSLHLEIPSWIHPKVAFVFLTSALH